MKYLLLGVILLLSGCATSFNITEYGTDAGILSQARVGGCVVKVPSGDIPAGLTLNYQGEKCTVNYGGEQ